MSAMFLPAGNGFEILVDLVPVAHVESAGLAIKLCNLLNDEHEWPIDAKPSFELRGGLLIEDADGTVDLVLPSGRTLVRCRDRTWARHIASLVTNGEMTA